MAGAGDGGTGKGVGLSKVVIGALSCGLCTPAGEGAELGGVVRGRGV